MKFVITLSICLCSHIILAQTKAITKTPNKSKSKANQNNPKRIDKQGEMKTYYMVFLVKGDKRDQDSATAAQIQNQHLEHLTKMWHEGKMDIAGPFLDDEDTKGICVYNVKTIEEAKALAESDPAVKSGRLKVVVRPWMSMKGSVLK
jgi:uncharacterized protein YciI